MDVRGLIALAFVASGCAAADHRVDARVGASEASPSERWCTVDMMAEDPNARATRTHREPALAFVPDGQLLRAPPSLEDVLADHRSAARAAPEGPVAHRLCVAALAHERRRLVVTSFRLTERIDRLAREGDPRRRDELEALRAEQRTLESARRRKSWRLDGARATLLARFGAHRVADEVRFWWAQDVSDDPSRVVALLTPVAAAPGPFRTRAHLELGEAQLVLGELDAARSHLEAALAQGVEPAAYARYLLAYVELNRDRPERAFEQLLSLGRALRSGPDAPSQAAGIRREVIAALVEAYVAAGIEPHRARAVSSRIGLEGEARSRWLGDLARAFRRAGRDEDAQAVRALRGDRR